MIHYYCRHVKLNLKSANKTILGTDTITVPVSSACRVTQERIPALKYESSCVLHKENE